LGQILSNNLLPVEVDDALVNQLRATYDDRCDIGDEDISLIAVAILKSQGVNKVGVLSLDEELLNWAHKIRSRKEVAFEGSQVSTVHLEPEYGLTFLSTIHDCCLIETPQFQGLAEFVEAQDIARVGRLSPETVTRKWRISQMIGRYLLESAVRKEQQRLAAVSA